MTNNFLKYLKSQYKDLLIPAIISITFIVGTFFSYDLSTTIKFFIIIGSVLWFLLFILEKYLIFKKQ